MQTKGPDTISAPSESHSGRQAIENLSFISSDFGDGEGFAAYHDLYSKGSDASLTGGRFHAKVQGYRFPRMIVFDRHLAGVAHERPGKRVARDGFDHIMIHMVVSGEMLCVTDGVTQVVKAGEIVVFDLTRPQKTSIGEARIATVSVARSVVMQTMPRALDFHGMVVLGGAATLLGDFIQSIVRNVSSISPDVALIATNTVGSLLGTMLGTIVGSSSKVAPIPEAARLNRVLAFIESELSRPDLSVDLISSKMGMSRSALYRLFEPLGGISSCISQRRLLALRQSLSRSGETRSFSAIAEAHGFTSDSHANRSFRTAFGVTPGDFRQTCRKGLREPEMSLDLKRGVGLERWHAELL